MDDLIIGVFICECGTNIAGTVNVDHLVEMANQLPDVVFTCKNRYTCSEPGQVEIQKAIAEHNLNRVVVAACTPRMHLPTFQNCVRSAGLNQYLLDMANIREHCSWVHQNEPDKATTKAFDLIKMAVARARYVESLEDIGIPVNRAALVIGGGVAGINASLDLAENGYDVFLVEKEPSVGGIMGQLAKTFPTFD